MATPKELLGESLDVPIHAPLVGPGIWRDETYAHGGLRVVDAPGPLRGTFVPWALELGRNQPQETDDERANDATANLDDRAMESADFATQLMHLAADLADTAIQ